MENRRKCNQKSLLLMLVDNTSNVKQEEVATNNIQNCVERIVANNAVIRLKETSTKGKKSKISNDGARH